MIKTIKNLLAIAMLGVAMASCTNNEGNNGTIIELPLSNFFALIDDTAGGTSAINGVGYKMVMNFTEMTGSIQITNLKLPDGTTFPAVTIEGLQLKGNNDGSLTLEGSRPVVSGNGLANVPEFTNVRFYYYERFIGTTYYPAATFQYVVNERYSVLSSYAKQVFYGTLQSYAEDGSKFETDDPYYIFDIDAEKRCGTLTMYQVRFVGAMPRPFDIVLKDIPFVVTGTNLIFSEDTIVPEIGDVPFEAYTLSRFTGSVDLNKGFKAVFECNPPKLGKYVVDITANYAASTTSGSSN